MPASNVYGSQLPVGRIIVRRPVQRSGQQMNHLEELCCASGSSASAYKPARLYRARPGVDSVNFVTLKPFATFGYQIDWTFSWRIEYDPTLKWLDSIPARMARSHVPAVTIGLIRGARVTLLRAFGESRPTSARIRTISTTLLRSRDRLRRSPRLDSRARARARCHWMSLSTPYWVDPDIRDDSSHTKLTLRIILSHQTGFPNWRWMTSNRKLAFMHPPGTTYGYSGEGFEYLRHALENKFGRSLQQLSDSILFRPLRMTSTTYGWNPAMHTSRFLCGHDRSHWAGPVFTPVPSASAP